VTAVLATVLSARIVYDFFSIGAPVGGRRRIYLGRLRDILRRIRAGKNRGYVDQANRVVLVEAPAGHGEPSLGAISLVCTHLGCTVHPTSDNRYLRCPCHGSRFEFTEGAGSPGHALGRVVQGPATRDLQRHRVASHNGRLFLEGPDRDA
jgi:Rieske Fe-S protein